MGQKVSPLAMRLGTCQKWPQRWYSEGGAYSQAYNLREKFENFFKQLFSTYPYGKQSVSKQFFLVDYKNFKGKNATRYRFRFFYKFRLLRNRLRLKRRKLKRIKKQRIQARRASRFTRRALKQKLKPKKRVKEKLSTKRFQIIKQS